MSLLLICLAISLLQPSLASYQTTNLPSDLTVRTTTGTYTALLEPSFPNVRQFRNIPYALPPTGSRRWLPPVPVPPSTAHHYAYHFPPSCPQYLPARLSVWNTNISDFSIDVAGQSHHAGTFAQTTAEDCLSLAVWAPRNITRDESKLPVILFLPGGSFQRGGVDVPYQVPVGWVQRSGRHIAVSANYRVNIMGFPGSGARGLEDKNPGLLDARAALEWVYANIGAFGGDRDKITLWGQSAGAVAADMLAYAWHEEPLARGLFLQSGSADVQQQQRIDNNPRYSNFSFVARALGCDFNPDDDQDGRAELECMRRVPVARIVNFVGGYTDNGTEPALVFKPADDRRTGFANYSARAEQGLLAKIPVLISTTANEEASLWDYPEKDVPAGPNNTAVDRATVRVFACLASNATEARAALGVAAYRYQYAGNFSNLTPLPWLGAYHAADIPLVMGSYERTGGEATGFERAVAETMQDYLLAFMEDPEDGLGRMGWRPHRERVREVGGTMLRFAAGDRVAVNASASEVDFACVSGAPYNSSPS